MTRVRSRRRILGLLALAVLIVAGWRASPAIHWKFRFWLAERAIAEGRLEDAEARLDALISSDQREKRPRLLRVQILRRQGRITEAEETLQRAVELGLPIEEGLREHALLTAGQDFARAEKWLRKVLEANPEDSEVRQALREGQSREQP